MTKILVIGLDGATWDLLMPWIKNGILPTFSRLIEEGTYGVLRGVIPPNSAAAWASIYTGKKPIRHGIYGFLDKNGNLINSKCIKGRKLWQILSEKEHSCCLINAPLTYPPEKINGYMISSWLASSKRKFTYPPSLSIILKKYGYKIDFTIGKEHLYAEEKLFKNRMKILPELREIAEKRFETSIKLIKEREWDFFMVVFTETDVMQHLFWDMKYILREFYKKIDSYINKIYLSFKEKCDGDEHYVFIISDHGFGPSPKKAFNIATLLKERPKKKKINILLNLLPSQLKTFIMKASHALKIRKILTDIVSPLLTVRGNCIYINREYLGEEEDYKEFKHWFVNKLRWLDSPEGGSLFSRIDELHGINVPDIIYLTQPEYAVVYDLTTDKRWIYNPWEIPGWHGAHPNGILIMKGEYVRKCFKIKEAEIYDITPTILYLMRIPIPRDMDGNVILKAFDPEFMKRNPVKYEET